MNAGLVLLVQDNPITRRMVRVTLQTEGYAVHEASDARAALAFMSRKTPDLIIQDLELPGVDGRELLSQLKTNGDIPVLACTGDPDKAGETSAWADLLLKPVEPSQVLRSVRTFLTPRFGPARVGTGRRILLVDDDPVQLKLSRIQLQQLGFDVVTAPGGDEALETLRQTRVDAVVCDVLMPRTDGFKVCLGVRQDPDLAEIPVVLVSAHYLEEMDRRFGERVGASAFVQRAPNADEIASALTATMKNRWAPRPLLGASELESEHLHRAMLQLERQVAANANLAEKTSLQAATLSVVGAISEALSSELDVNVALGRAVTHCLDAAGLTRGAVYLASAEGDLTGRTVVGRDGIAGDAWRSFFGHPELFARACDSRRPIAVPSPEVPREMAADILRGLGGATSALLAPLTCLQGCLGLVLMVSDRNHLADSDWIAFAEATGTLLAQSMVLGRSFRRLRDSELRYRALMDQANDAIFVVDVDGRVLETNRRGEALLATPRESLVGKLFTELVAPSDRHRQIQHFEKLVTEGTFRADSVVVMRSDGKRVFVDASASKVQVGKDVLFYVSLRDVTVRVETEEALVRARIDFRNVIEQAPDGIVIRRGDQIMYTNPAFARGLGYDSPDELIGKHVTTDLVTPEMRTRAEARIQRGEHSGHAEEFALRNKQGDTCHVEVSPPQKIQFEGGPAALIITRDVTERKKMQAQLMVSDRMASVGTLAAGVAHEINNPLATVLANVDLALRDAQEVGARPGAKEDLVEELRDAREAVDRVRQIARDLKVFSRGDDEAHGPVDVQRAIESSLRMAWNEIRHRARLVKDFGPVPPVDANESRLGQVFLNLVINAAQALPEGQADKNVIRLRTSTDAKGRAVIEIIDSGPGIPPDVMRRLFTPFFSTKPVGQGTGLGLSICQRIVTALGGEITLDSEPGKGTIARVVLPPAKLEVPAEVKAAAAARRASRRGRVLIIDDEPMVGTAVRRTLQSEHDVTQAISANEALGLIQSGLKFDVILCDLMMPQVTGMDFFDAIAKLFPEQAARVIFLTGGAFTPRAREFLDETENQRLEKPFDPQNLRALVNDRIR